MKYYKYIRIVLILIPIIILAVLFYKDFNPDGYLKVDYDFCREDPFVSKFSPTGRVLEIEKIKTVAGKDCQQKMVVDPVYFDVRLTQKFDQARLKLWYQKDLVTPLRIGPAINLSNWQWQLKDINYLLTTQNFSEGWLVGTAEYDLKNIQPDKNILRFLISSPGLDLSAKEIVFGRVAIEFIKEPLTKNNFFERLKEWIKFSNIYYALN